MRALVVGGGIGGLTAALALVERGHTVEVIEQAPALTEIGAGIQLGPNATKALDQLGALKHLDGRAYEPERLQMRMGRSGRAIFDILLKDISNRRWRGRYLQVHRADLIDALVTALDGRATLSLGVGAEGYDGNRVTLTDGSARSADIIVGADGLHSRLRAQMHGALAPSYSGNVAWRLLAPRDALGDLAPPPAACIWVGPRQHAVTTYVRGGDIVNCALIVEQAEPGEEQYDAEGGREELAARFTGWHPTLRGIIERAESVRSWALYTRPSLASWSDGPVCLIGDAAHPMLPSLAQGGAQAIEDATTLAKLLSIGDGDPVRAGQSLYQGRIERTSKVQRLSAQRVKLFHKSNPLSQLAAYGPIFMGGQLMASAIHAQSDWIFGYEEHL